MTINRDYLVTALFCLGFFLSLTAGMAGTRELFIIVLCGLWLLPLLDLEKGNLFSSAEGGVSLFLLGLLPALLFSPALHLSLLTFAKLLAAVGYLLAAHKMSQREGIPRQMVFGVVLLGVLVLCLFGVEQMLFPKEMPSHWVSQAQRNVLPFRVTSLFINPNPWGGFCAVALAVILTVLVITEEERVRWGAVFLAALLLMNLVASFSRGAWLSSLLAVFLTAFYGHWQKVRRPGLYHAIVLCLTVGIIAACWLFPAVEARLASMKKSGELGMNQRSLLYRGVLRHIKANLPFGSGLRTFQTLFPRYRLAGGQYVYEAHSDLLHILAEAGLTGFLGLLFMGAVFFRLNLAAPVDKGLPGLALLIGFLLAANVVTFLHYTFLTIPLFATVGLTLQTREGDSATIGFVGRATLSIVLALCTLYWGALYLSQGPFSQANSLFILSKKTRGQNKVILLKEALKEVDKVLSTLPWRDDAHHLRGRIFKALGNNREAQKSFQSALSHNELEVTYRAALAEVEWVKGEKKAAMQLFDEALEGDPYSESLLLRKALLLQEMGQREAAINILFKALQTNPQFLIINRKAYEPIVRTLLEMLKRAGRLAEAHKVAQTYGNVLSLPAPTR